MATLQELMLKNKKHISKSMESNGKPDSTKEGLKQLLGTTSTQTIKETEIKFKDTSESIIESFNEDQSISNTSDRVHPIAFMNEKNEIKTTKKTKSEPRSSSEPRSISERASNKNLVIASSTTRKYLTDESDYLSRDENRFYKFVCLMIEEKGQNEVKLTRDVIQQLANINRGRFYTARQGLIEKKLIEFREQKDERNNMGVFYRVIKE